MNLDQLLLIGESQTLGVVLYDGENSVRFGENFSGGVMVTCAQRGGVSGGVNSLRSYVQGSAQMKCVSIGN